MQRKVQNIDNCSAEQKAILSAVAFELFQKPLELPEAVNWDAVLTESVNQAVFPLVYSVVRDRLPSDVKTKWETMFLQNIASNIRVTAAHSYLHKLLTEYDIPYVILKGVASARYYPHPELRTMGDVDFLVEPTDLIRCSEVLERRGMRRTDDGTHEYHRAYTFQSADYELHWALPGIPAVGGERLRDRAKSVFTDALCVPCDSGTCMVPSDFHHGLTLLLHTAAHMTTTGIGLRHLCDWAVFAERFSDQEFCGLIEECLIENGLWEFAKILTAMCIRFLGASPKRWVGDVDGALLESLMDDIWQGGNFGGKNPQRRSHSVLMIDARTHRIERRRSLVSLADAIHRKAALYYPRMASGPVLRPIAWLAVCCRYSWRVLTGKRPWLKFGKDARIAKQRKELFKRLRLFER